MVSGAVAAANAKYIGMLWKEAAIGMTLGLVSTSRGSPFFLFFETTVITPFVRFQILIYILLSYYFRAQVLPGTSGFRFL